MRFKVSPRILIVSAAVGFLGVSLFPTGGTYALWRDAKTVELPALSGNYVATAPTPTKPTPTPTDSTPTPTPTPSYDPSLPPIPANGGCWGGVGQGATAGNLVLSCNLPVQAKPGDTVGILGEWSVAPSGEWRPFDTEFLATGSDTTRAVALPLGGVVSGGASYTFIIRASYAINDGLPSVPTEITLSYIWVP